MISALLTRINPFMLYVKIGIVLIVGLYIGWLKYCLMDAESDLKVEKANYKLLESDLKDFKDAYDTLAKKTAEQNAQINAMSEETSKAIQRAKQAKNNAVSKLNERNKQLSVSTLESKTCEQAIERVKSELSGSML